MTSISGAESPPQHLITEPLRSFNPVKLENGDLRMAIATAGQHAYSFFGEEATLTEDFLSRDFKTWEGGLVSINHENNHDWVKAKMYDLEYDSEKKLVISSFSGIPDWLKSLIYSDDYRGVSQECIPIETRKNSMDVIKGYGTGATFVTDPYEPAATQEMGVGVRPALSAILSQKYPTQIDDTMTEKTGGGIAAISTEAFESTVSENVKLKSQISTLESDLKKKDEELVSWEKKYNEQVNGESVRIKIESEKAVSAYKSELERGEIISELKEYLGDDAEEYLSTNPSIETIKATIKREKSRAGQQKADAARGVGSHMASTEPDEDAEAEEAWKSSHVRL